MPLGALGVVQTGFWAPDLALAPNLEPNPNMFCRGNNEGKGTRAEL